MRRRYEGLCRHCNAKPVSRPRGLCWNCFYTPGVKDLYPITSKHGIRGIGNGMAAVVLPPRPTSTLAGTRERLRVYRKRAEKRLALNHPDDNYYRKD